MNLRKHPKQKTIHDAGTVRSGKKYNEKRLKKIWYTKHVEKKAAIDANMIKLIAIDKCKNPLIHLKFWQENLQSDYPVVALRKSNLKHGGLGVFVTDNCYFLPGNLMYIPNCNQDYHDEPAEKGTVMSAYQFALRTKGKTVYLFPTLEPNPTLPCAQFINTPLRRRQGHYSNNVDPECRQAMHIGNVSLLGKPPGGFRGHQIIYPGFEILGPYMSSYHLLEVDDYQTNRATYEDRWIKETQEAISRERDWISEIKQKCGTQICQWIKAASLKHYKLTQEPAIIAIGRLRR